MLFPAWKEAMKSNLISFSALIWKQMESGISLLEGNESKKQTDSYLVWGIFIFLY